MLKELIKEILKEELTGESETKVDQVDTITKHLIGKICMFRTYSAGVHFGELISKNNQECLVRDSRRIWYWAKANSLSQLAMEGDKDLSNCKIAMTLPLIVLDQVIEVIPMSDDAINCLYGASEWKK